MNSDRSDFVRGGADQSYDKSYAMSGKIMLSAIVILFFVVIFMVCLHLYARWYLIRSRRRNAASDSNRHRRRHRGGGNLVFQVDAGQAQASRGLDAAVLNSLPIFVFSDDSAAEKESPIECAVCLSEFEDKETGRRLPKCGHCFHTECIDMWFRSHSTCPLCRSPVESSSSSSDPEVRVEIAAGAETEVVNPVLVPSGSGQESGFCSDCAAEASSAAEARIKTPACVSIEVPARSDFGELGFGSPASQTTPTSFRSPMSRMLSFTRILSREKRNGVVSPNNNNNNNNCSASCSTVNELDIENGKEGTQ